MLRHVAKFSSLESSDRVHIVHALAVVAVVSACQRILPYTTLVGVLGTRIAKGPSRSAEHEPRHPAFERIARAVDIALRVVSKGDRQCLRRSLVLAHLLRRYGAEIRVGGQFVGNELSAHAWVEVAGHPVAERAASGGHLTPFMAKWSDSGTASTG